MDTGADISLLKPDNFDKTRTFDPDGNVTVKSVDGSTIETLGAVETVVKAGLRLISLVNRWMLRVTGY